MRMLSRARRGRPQFSICLFSSGLAAAAFLAACAVGPNYRRPDAPSATTWELAEPWREGAPKDAIPKGQWWTVFRDSDLDALESQAVAANQAIKVSLARLEQARA